MAKKIEKTNAMRLLDSAKISYTEHRFDCTEALSGAEVAKVLNQPAECVFKTLVTVGKSREHYVFMVPVLEELDLKKAAKTVGEKSIEMIKSKELLPLTGYVHGGCSPIGMKKSFKTVIDITAENCEKIFFSGGKIGLQIESTLENLQSVVPLVLADICK